MLRTNVALFGFAALALALAPVAIAAPSARAAESAASADGDITWSVAPAPTGAGARNAFDYSVDPGTQIVDSVIVTNSSAAPAEFLIYATDATNELATGAFSLLKHDVPPTDLGSWITPATDKVTIQPGTQATIPFNLLVPSDATPGDHVAGIVASILTKDTANGSAVTLEQRVGARVYLSVSGIRTPGVDIAGATSSFTASLNPFAPGDMTVGFDIRNTGNTRIDVNDTVVITGPFGIPLGEITPQPLSNLLPRQTVHVEAHVPSVVALLLAWSTISVTPGELGSAGKVASTTPDAVNTPSATSTGSPAATPTSESSASAAPADAARASLDYVPVSSTVLAATISWTLLALVVAVIAAIYLIWRYVSGTRERFYFAIEEAAAAARGDSGTTADSGSRE